MKSIIKNVFIQPVVVLVSSFRFIILMKKLTLYFGVLCIFFGINAYIFNHKIKKINVRLNRITDQSVCLGQAKSIASEIFYEHAKKKIDSLRK